MDTIIIGLILFIVAISATIFYDKHKDDVIAILKHQWAKYKPRQESAKRSNVATNATNGKVEYDGDDYWFILNSLRKVVDKINKKVDQNDHI